MGGIPNPCAGCGDPACSCCFADSIDIERDSGTGNQGDCYSLVIANGAVGTHLCTEAIAGPPLADGDQVVVCAGGAPSLRDFESACVQLNALPAAVGPALAGDEVVIFDGLTCVRKTITPSDCPPAPAPVIDIDCVAADLDPVFCSPFTNDLRTLPRGIERTADIVLAGWAGNLLFFAQGAPILMASSIAGFLPNPSCQYPMEVMLVAEPGHVRWTGPSGVWFSVLIEERINGGGWTGVHTFYCDYTGQTSAGLQDSHALPGWNRTFTIPASGGLFYEWRMFLTRLHPNLPNINGVVENFSSRTTLIGGSQ